jgi:hypothetical protein
MDYENCLSCGKPMTDHLGIIGTCNRLQLALQYLDDIATGRGIINYNTYARMAIEHINKPSELKS